MTTSSQAQKSHRINVLLLDGGGVRGLSSLLILQELMRKVNDAFKSRRAGGQDLRPRDVFQFVAGTSTGGLIAIMLGKLGLSVEDCIEEYHSLSEQIFGKSHPKGKLSKGLARSRYSGKRLRDCVRGLLKRKSFAEDHSMIRESGTDAIACAVVCREHKSSSKYSGLVKGAVCICSHPCETNITAQVCDAARATSAAPTYFPVQQIGDRYFVDGGMEYNNPTYAILDHCTKSARVQVASQSTSTLRPSSLNALPAAATQRYEHGNRHGNLDFTSARYVNIGTGSKTDETPERHRETFMRFIPGSIRTGMLLMRTLTEFATESEKTADIMRTFSALDTNYIYERFSATNGVCWIKLDAYKRKQMDTIKGLTKGFLQTKETQQSLDRVARDIVEDYLLTVAA